MSTIANPITSTSAATPPTKAAAARIDPLADESTFLLLLVSQLKNQDPLSPVDSNQFVSQLTQYSQLEQLIGIHSDTTSFNKASTPDGTDDETTPATTPIPIPSSTDQSKSTTGAQ